MDFSSLTPLAGGWSGSTYLGEAAGERTVVRIYAGTSHRGAGAHEVDAALLRLVRGLVPVPEVLEILPADDSPERPALLVTTYVEGVRGDELLATLDAAGRRVLGTRLGDLVADLGGMPQLRAGSFVDGDLRVLPFAETADGLPGWVESHEPRLGHLTTDESAGLRAVALEAQALLDTAPRVCLVHSDLNPKNVLIDAESLRVAALVDWEFAHAGHPFTDLGNLLRFERDPGVRRCRPARLRRTPRGHRRRRARAGAGRRHVGPRRARHPPPRQPRRRAGRPAAARDRPVPGRGGAGARLRWRRAPSRAGRAGWTGSDRAA